MLNKRIRLAERRAALIAQVASQRAQLAEVFEPLRVPLTYADKALHAYRYVAQRPILMAGAAALAVVVRQKRWLFALENGWLIWRLVSAARRKREERAELKQIN